ncbi:hypothetical protein QFC20_005356 [Naganishia adeliensis]|uniref:Uncharacterized protein n=1 Tax=Naganishia adeliensis TaxID=92952 RepID=A0ACC2VNJ3_9TREE|nr:hypothetical protein QFC20_005356 [Naganishia adeliensis]
MERTLHFTAFCLGKEAQKELREEQRDKKRERFEEDGDHGEEEGKEGEASAPSSTRTDDDDCIFEIVLDESDAVRLIQDPVKFVSVVAEELWDSARH